MRSGEYYFGGNKHQITLKWAHTVSHKSASIFEMFILHNENQKDDIHTPFRIISVYTLVMTSKSILQSNIGPGCRYADKCKFIDMYLTH